MWTRDGLCDMSMVRDARDGPHGDIVLYEYGHVGT